MPAGRPAGSPFMILCCVTYRATTVFVFIHQYISLYLYISGRASMSSSTLVQADQATSTTPPP